MSTLERVDPVEMGERRIDVYRCDDAELILCRNECGEYYTVSQMDGLATKHFMGEGEAFRFIFEMGRATEEDLAVEKEGEK